MGIYGDTDIVRAVPFDAIDISLAIWWSEPALGDCGSRGKGVKHWEAETPKVTDVAGDDGQPVHERRGGLCEKHRETPSSRWPWRRQIGNAGLGTEQKLFQARLGPRCKPSLLGDWDKHRCLNPPFSYHLRPVP